jgi:hypothetical protein
LSEKSSEFHPRVKWNKKNQLFDRLSGLTRNFETRKDSGESMPIDFNQNQVVPKNVFVLEIAVNDADQGAVLPKATLFSFFVTKHFRWTVITRNPFLISVVFLSGGLIEFLRSVIFIYFSRSGIFSSRSVWHVLQRLRIRSCQLPWNLIFDNIEQTPRLWFSMVSRARKIVHDPSHEEERRANGHSILTIATIATGNVFSIEY